MPAVTRDELLASVHELRPGDLLILRVPKATPVEYVNKLSNRIHNRLGDIGIRALVITGDVDIEVYRQQPGPDEAPAGVVERGDRPAPTPAGSTQPT